MAEATTIARPYAQAAFEFAQESKKLQDWSDSLQFAAAVARDPQMSALIGNPKIAPEKLLELLTSVCGDQLKAERLNFIKILVDNGRLAVLPEIAELFEQLKADAEKTIKAVMTSASPVTKELQKKYETALKKRLGRDVTLECIVDESIVGGAVIRAGDLVIDGSVAGQLDRLASVLTH